MTVLRSLVNRMPRHSFAATSGKFFRPSAAVSAVVSNSLSGNASTVSGQHSTQWAQGQALREFSTPPRRAYPQYSIFGETCALSIKCVMPSFKRAGLDGIAVEKRGRLLMEFVPRSNTGAGFLWQEKISFSVSVEELGLMISQLPGTSVELSHVAHPPGSSDSPGVSYLSGDGAVDKVLTAVPGEGATVNFKLDFMKDGVGGQPAPGVSDVSAPITPLEITLQAGEFEVIKSICQTSIPYLLGWNTTLDIATGFSISQGIDNSDRERY